MTIDPRIPYSAGNPHGVAARLGELDRRLRAVEAGRGGGWLGANSITSTSVAPNSITTGHIQAGSITASLIAAGAITANAIQADAINATHIVAGAVTTDELAANSVTAAKVAADAIATVNLQAGSVTAAKIAAGTITATQIAANTITAGQIAAGTITATQIASGTITASQIAAGTITATLLASDTAMSDAILGRLINATNITTTGLSAISANLGSINAGTVTGATIRSAASGARWQGDSTGIRGFNSAGEVTFFFDNATGKITTLAGVGGPNLLNNSSFENPDTPLAGWTVYSNLLTPAPTLDTAVFPLGSKHGTRAARLTNGTDTTGDMGVVAADSTNWPRVDSGKTYTLSVWGQPVSVGANFRVHIHWLDSSNAIIGSGSTGTLVAAAANAWTRATVSAAAPPGAVRALCYSWVVNPSSGLVFYLDGFQLEEGQIETSFAPRPDEILPDAVEGSGGAGQIKQGTIIGSDLVVNTITAAQIAAGTITATEIAANAITTAKLNAGAVTAAKIAAGTITATEIASNTITADKINFRPSGGNLLSNSSWEVAGGFAFGTPYTPVSGEGGLSTVKAWHGTTSWRGRQTGTVGSAYLGHLGWLLDVRPGEKYTVSYYINPDVAMSNAHCTAFFYTALDAYVTELHQGYVNVNANVWTRVSSTFTVPNDATITRMRVGIQIDSAPQNQWAYIDAIQCERGDVLSEWSQYIDPTVIDGSTVTAATIRTAATGARIQLDSTGLASINASSVEDLSLRPADGLRITAGTMVSDPNTGQINEPQRFLGFLTTRSLPTTKPFPFTLSVVETLDPGETFTHLIARSVKSANNDVSLQMKARLVSDTSTANWTTPSGESGIVVSQHSGSSNLGANGLVYLYAGHTAGADVNTFDTAVQVAAGSIPTKNLLTAEGKSDFAFRSNVNNDDRVWTGNGAQINTSYTTKTNKQKWRIYSTGFCAAVQLGFIRVKINGVEITQTRFFFSETGVHRDMGVGVGFTTHGAGTSVTVVTEAVACSFDGNDRVVVECEEVGY